MESVLKFETPHTALVSGPSSSGKTSFIFKALLHAKGLFKDPPKKIYYCFGVKQKLYDDMKNALDTIEFIEGLPTKDMLEMWAADEPGSKMLVLDDLLQKASRSSDVVDIYCQYSHHYNYITWLVTQNVFYPGKEFRTISLNTHIFIVFRNARDELKIQTLGRQITPGRGKYFIDSYRRATTEKYSYLCIDVSPHSDPKYKLRTNVLPGQLMTVFLPEKTI